MKLSDSDRAEGILVTGGKGRVAALKGDGTLAWEAPFDTAPAGGVAEPVRGKLWLALIARSVVVLDSRTGSTIAELKTAGERQLCWLEVKGQSSPLLIVSTRQRIYVYRLFGRSLHQDHLKVYRTSASSAVKTESEWNRGLRGLRECRRREICGASLLGTTEPGCSRSQSN